jgi:hypothetical protein
VGRKTHTFDSRQQEKWAFATRKAWARRWAENTEASGKPLPSSPQPSRKPSGSAATTR